MRFTRSAAAAPLAVGILSAAMTAMPSRALAGELTVAWNAAGPAASTSYRVFVGERPGVYDRVVDAGSSLRATITDLEDGRLHYFAVKAFDAAGHESPGFSAELACMPRPRVDAVEAPRLAPGGAGWVTLRGANFDSEVQVRANEPNLRVRASVLAPDGSLAILVESTAPAGSGALAPSSASFTLLSACRRADAWFGVHPQTADVDGSGDVDEADLRAVSAALGLRRGERGYLGAADLDGDGVVDGRDLDRVVARLRPSSPSLSSIPPSRGAPPSREAVTEAARTGIAPITTPAPSGR